VVCKLSGLVTEAEPNTWTPAVLRPYVDHLLASFGPERLLFGSDWPVVKLAASYGRWLETAIELTAPLSERERAAIFADNARRVYRLS
jgi:L-fuconolactonase